MVLPVECKLAWQIKFSFELLISKGLIIKQMCVSVCHCPTLSLTHQILELCVIMSAGFEMYYPTLLRGHLRETRAKISL